MTGRVSSPRLVGREEELARLRAALEDAGHGRSRFVLIAGDAGMGKSRLVAELIGSPGPDIHAMIGGCLAIADGGLPYAPLAEALRRLGRELDPAMLDRVLGPARAELARLVPDLAGAGRTAAGSSAGVADRAGQARLFELLLGLLDRLGRDRRVCLVVEDVHWADDATRDLLTYLVANLRTEPVAVVATLRTDATDADPRRDRWLAELMRGPGCERIDLGPLSPAEVAEQLRAILGSPPSSRVAAAIAARSGGNALFVEALVAAGAGSGAAGWGAAGSGAADADGGATAPLPGTLREMLAARIRDLPPDTETMVRALAVAGRAVDDRLIGAATGLPTAAVHASLRDAIARHLVAVNPRTADVDLRHVLLREAIVADLLAGERRALHAALAAALTANPELADPSPAGAAGEVAHHWAAADRPVEAFRAALVAADAALAVRAYGEAARHRRRALDLYPRLAPDIRAEAPDEVALLLDAEDAANLASDFAAAARLVERGLLLVDPAIDPVRAGILESRLGYHRWLAGRSEEALAHHRRAVDLVPADPPSLARARVVRGLGGAIMGLGRYRESAAVCEEAIAAARAADAPLEEGRALDMLGMDRFGIGDIEGGIAALEDACRLARAHDPGEGLIVGLHNLAYHLTLADRPDDALAAALEGIAAARRDGLDRRYGLALRAVAADILLRLGRWDEADALVGEGRSMDPDGEGPLHLVIVRLRLATARGRFDDARKALAVGNRMAAGDVDFDLVAYFRTADAELACWAGRPDLASAAVDAGLAALEGSDDVFLAGPLLALGARAAADRAETARSWRAEAALAEALSVAAEIEARVGGRAGGLAPDGPGGPALGGAALRSPAPGDRGSGGPAPDDPGSDERPPITRGRAATTSWALAECGRAEAFADETAWADLAAAWRDLEMPAHAAYAAWRRAEAILAGRGRRGKRTAAANNLAFAAAEAARLGAGPLGAAVADLARRAGIDLAAIVPATDAGAAPAPVARPRHGAEAQTQDGTEAPSALPGPTRPGDGRRALEELGLSARQLEVLELVAGGRTNAEIARALSLSPSSVSTHVGRIRARLGVSGRLEAATVATQLGLVDALAGSASPLEPGASVAARTFMFTDIVGSTALIEAIGDGAWSSLRAWHDATLRGLFEAHGGVEVDHAGDGFFVAFPSPAPAVACAVAIQRTLAEHREAAGFAPEVRIGLHHGQAVRTGTGWTGREVHLAARLMARAGAGEIVASAMTVTAARVRPAGAELVSLPGLADRVEIARVSWRQAR